MSRRSGIPPAEFIFTQERNTRRVFVDTLNRDTHSHTSSGTFLAKKKKKKKKEERVDGHVDEEEKMKEKVGKEGRQRTTKQKKKKKNRTGRNTMGQKPERGTPTSQKNGPSNENEKTQPYVHR